MATKKHRNPAGSTDNLFHELETALNPDAITFPSVVDRIAELMDQVHEAPQDEKEKLKKKDAVLKRGLRQLQAVILQADHLPQGTARILLSIVGALMHVEGILEELKRLHGIK